MEPWTVGGYPWMWIFPLIFLIVLLILFFRRGGSPMGGTHDVHGKAESAHELLDRRYARGEITPEDISK